MVSLEFYNEIKNTLFLIATLPWKTKRKPFLLVSLFIISQQLISILSSHFTYKSIFPHFQHSHHPVIFLVPNIVSISTDTVQRANNTWKNLIEHNHKTYCEYTVTKYTIALYFPHQQSLLSLYRQGKYLGHNLEEIFVFSQTSIASGN